MNDTLNVLGDIKNNFVKFKGSARHVANTASCTLKMAEADNLKCCVKQRNFNKTPISQKQINLAIGKFNESHPEITRPEIYNKAF